MKADGHDKLVAASYLKKHQDTPLAAALIQLDKKKTPKEGATDLSGYFEDLKKIALLIDNVPIDVVIEESRWLKRMGVNSVLFFATEHWPEIVGEQLGRMTFPTQYFEKNKTLKVSTVSAIAHSEIIYKRNIIIQAMNDYFRREIVEEVFFSKMMVK